jgi:hypothetical protein
MPDRDRTAGIRLDLDDAAELAKLLLFLGGWFDGPDAELLAASLRRFVGTTGYGIDELQADIGSFAVLLV